LLTEDEILVPRKPQVDPNTFLSRWVILLKLACK
jgi:hypothetical protein